ncbi:hypothetical protein [Gordonia sp. CPCC 205333]|uniref:hypothetical protein n=1 Tax=Gordonia sp. CPCC 205333 TaxID=3140790 RepID=UPI003AF3D479
MKHKVIAVIVMAFAILAGGALSPPGQANAAGFGPDPHTGGYYFHSPSGQYSCAIFPANARQPVGDVGCQGRTNVSTAAEGACLRKWGPAGMAMALDRGPAYGRFKCVNQGFYVGGTTANGGPGRLVKPVLPYGQSLNVGGVTCTMRTSGITCRRNRTGNGFFISLQSHRGF